MMPAALHARMQRLGLLRAAPPEANGSAPRRCSDVEALPGTEITTPHGVCWLREWRVDMKHGAGWARQQIAEPQLPPVPAMRIECEAPEALRSVLHRRPPRAGTRVAFDTETTGLHSGAGVHVFLMGLASWEGGAVVLQQFLMRSPTEEAAMLYAVREELQRHTGMLSFCGRGFDVPRTKDRLSLAGFSRSLPVFPHDDLAPVARRFLKGRYSDCRLKTLESQFLGFQRVDDLPGAECPREWFALQRGQPHRMAAVLHHNALDLLSLFALEHALLRELAQPTTPEAELAAAICWREAGELPSAHQRMRV